MHRSRVDECNLHVGVSLRCLSVRQHCEKLVTCPNSYPVDPPPSLTKEKCCQRSATLAN